MSLLGSWSWFGDSVENETYAGLFGSDDYFLDKYFKSYKILSFHAVLHDASGFVFEYSEKGPSYPYFLPCALTNEYLGHVTGLVFYSMFNLLECWNHDQLLLIFKTIDIKIFLIK